MKNQIKDCLKLIAAKEDFLKRNPDHAAAGKIAQEIRVIENLIMAAEDLQANQDTEALQHHSAILRLKNNILALEAVAIIHGIYDLPAWLAKGPEILFNTACQLYHAKTIQTPHAQR